MRNSLLLLVVLFAVSVISSNTIAQNGLHFDGINDRVNCGNSTQVQITGNQITLEAWIKPTSFGPNNWSNNIIDKEEWTPQEGYMLRCGAGGLLNFNLGGGIGWNELTSSTPCLTLNTWQHVAGTYDGSYMRIYVDGVLIDSVAKTVSIAGAASQNLIIGDNSQMGRNFEGYIDEVRIWNVARTKAEINADMNNEICSGQTGLKAYYRLNEGVAGGTNTGVTTAINSAATGPNATLGNFALTGTTSNWVTGASLTAAPQYGGDTIIASICAGQPYQFGSQTIWNTGFYTENFVTANGCDSTVYLDLTVVQINVSVTLNSFTLNSLQGSAQYQWLDCNNNYAVIPGATNQTFSPTVNGTYAVEISMDGCMDTSACIAVTGIGIDDYNGNKLVSVYPNPVKSEFFADISKNFEYADYKLIDISGQIIQSGRLTKEVTRISTADISPGVYFFVLTSDLENRSIRIVKQ